MLKKILFYVIALLLVVSCCELCAYAGLALLYKTLSPGESVERRHKAALPVHEKNDLEKQDVLVHPYIGYVANPNYPDGSKAPRYEYLSSAGQGFFSEKSMVSFDREGTFTVAMLGGSVAHYFFLDMCAELEKFFASLPENHGKEVRLFDLSNWAYKQPQQLMAIEYLRSQGVTFDAVINLDGFNEVATAFVMNVPRNVSIFMPGNWDLLAGNMPTKRATVLFGEKAFTQSLREKLAELVSGWPFKSYSVRLVWAGLDALGLKATDRLDRELAREKFVPRSSDALLVSPSQKVYLNENFWQNDDLLMSRALSQWATASIQINNTVVGDGGKYFHFLQPNQYAPESKPFSVEEKQYYVSDRNPGAPFARKGYPWLQKFGRLIKDKGLFFHDLTRVFAGTSATIYNDDCCHVNRTGNEMLLKAMEEFILKKWKDKPTRIANFRQPLEQEAAGMFDKRFVFDVLNDPGNDHLILSGFGVIEKSGAESWLWGYGSESVVKFYANTKLPALLEVDLTNTSAGQNLSVDVNGETLSNIPPCPVAEGPFDRDHQMHIAAPFVSRPGLNTIRFRATKWNGNTDPNSETRPFSVKFDRIRVHSVQ